MKQPIEHFIQKHILKTLTHVEVARFKDMRPKNVDSNLYNYHLKLLIKAGLVAKLASGQYCLSPNGIRYADHVSLDKYIYRQQPKILTLIVNLNKEGQILLWPKYKQPFIGRWSLPSGKMHYEDSSVKAAVQREIQYLTTADNLEIEHKGVVEYLAYAEGVLFTHTLAHVFRTSFELTRHERAQFFDLNKISELDMSPGTLDTIKVTLEETEFFYRHFEFREYDYIR